MKSNNIFIIGFMGSGKTTLGKKLAQQLNYTFFDLDQLIEVEEKKTINELFNNNGEDYFRLVETKVLNQIINSKNNFVLSLGGGTPCFNKNIDLMNETGVTVYLKYNVGILFSRLLNAKQKRPLLENKTEEGLKTYINDLLIKREQDYKKAKIIVEGINLKAVDVSKKILEFCGK